MEVEKKVSEYIKQNEKNGLTLEDIDQFRKKSLQIIQA
jgi:hypothetical protein